MHYNAIVLGGGLYGCKVALALRAAGVRKVLLVEPNALVDGATFVNQNRVHGGYHYPRSIQTAESAQKNYVRFLADHAPTIERNFSHHYAIAEGSLTTPAEFERVMAQVGAPLERVDHPMLRNVLATYRVEEVVFNIEKMRGFLGHQLHQAGVPVAPYRGYVEDVGDAYARVRLEPHGDVHTADYVFNCTYGNLVKSGARVKTRLQYEWCEVALFDVARPSVLDGMDITIMDGPFWSLMKYPSQQCHALTHVEHTVHHRWFTGDRVRDIHSYESNWKKMLAAAHEHCALMFEGSVKYRNSLWTTRVVLADNEPDDGRPILWEYDERGPRVISVLGSKFNSVYDAVALVEQGEWRERRHRINVRREGRRALVGHGFIGKNLDAPGRFTDYYDSKNIGEMRGHYEQIVVAAPSAEKWRANKNPLDDFTSTDRLATILSNVTANDVVLVSTIDVRRGDSGAYGLNRLLLERIVRDAHPNARIVRLPALYGPHLKKNALFDILNGNPLRVDKWSMFQWYNIEELWGDLKDVQPGETREILPAPVTVDWLCQQVGVSPTQDPYVFRIVTYDEHVPGGGYTHDEAYVKAGLTKFIREYKC